MARLRCPHVGCAHAVTVTANQAGSVVKCPDGHSLKVPNVLVKKSMQQKPASKSSVATDSVDDWAKLEQSGKTLDQRVRLLCPECDHEFSARVDHETVSRNCPQCDETVPIESRIGQSDSESSETDRPRHLARESRRSQREVRQQETAAWVLVGSGLNHLVFAGTVILGLQIMLLAAIGPLLIPAIIAADSFHREDQATAFLLFHGLVYSVEVLLLLYVVFSSDELLESLDNIKLAAVLGCGIGVYWLPRLWGDLTDAVVLLILGIMVIGLLLAVIRTFWGIMLCFAAPAGTGLRMVLVVALLLATVSVVCLIKGGEIVKLENLLRPGAGAANVTLPKSAKNFFLAAQISVLVAHLLFAEFLRRVTRAKNDELSTQFIAGYQSWFVVLSVAQMLVGGLLETGLLRGIFAAFTLLTLAIGDIALRNRFIVALETARVRCG